MADVSLLQELLAEQQASIQRDGHHGRIARYLAGDHDMPYVPEDAKREYRVMAERAITNFLPRVSDTFVKLLAVDGIRSPESQDDDPSWAYWRANKLSARQTIAHRGAIEYGASYVLVLPGTKGPVIRPLDPLRSMAWYEDEDDEWPVYGIHHVGALRNGDVKWRFIDATDVVTFTVGKGADSVKIVKTEKHKLGVCPMVRFRDRLDGKPVGIIKPLIVPQDRINDTVFLLDMAMHYASFRQRWATGLSIPVDDRQTIPNPAYDPDGPADETNPQVIANPMFGQEIETFDAAVDRVWISTSKDSRFGDFAQTDVMGHLKAFEMAVNTITVLGQQPSGMLQGNLVNTGADALATLYDVTTRQAEVYRLLFGESWEQVFDIAAKADGATVADDAQVHWADTDARAFAATIDGLGKMVQMLNVPYEAVWERIPGVTQTDVLRWRTMVQNGNGIQALTEALNRQSQPVNGNQNTGTQQTQPLVPAGSGGGGGNA